MTCSIILTYNYVIKNRKLYIVHRKSQNRQLHFIAFAVSDVKYSAIFKQ